MTEQQIELYRGTAIRFIENNSQDLVRIYLENRKNEEGLLGINLADIETTKNIEVAYIPLHILPEELLKSVNERKEVNNENIIYFLLITPFEEKIIELDIRTLNQIKPPVSQQVEASSSLTTLPEVQEDLEELDELTELEEPKDEAKEE